MCCEKLRIACRYRLTKERAAGAEALIETRHLFPELSRRFNALLNSLAPEDWMRPVSSVWRVRDVVTHLFDGSLRRLSSQRDGYAAAGAFRGGSNDELVDYLNQLNADWVRATERLSPRVLIELIQWSDERLAGLFASLDPHARAIWPVAWAGEAESKNWFDIAREYTEKWHHAQQVFEATGRPSAITDRELMHPCLESLIRGVPHALRDRAAPANSAVQITITGPAGGDWMIGRDQNRWSVLDGSSAVVLATVKVDQNEAWKLLMKRTSPAQALAMFPSLQVSGDERLWSAALETVSVMA
jgi:hypothetical protein